MSIKHFFFGRKNSSENKFSVKFVLETGDRMAAATSVVVLDRGNNTTCTVNLHGKNDFTC